MCSETDTETRKRDEEGEGEEEKKANINAWIRTLKTLTTTINFPNYVCVSQLMLQHSWET